MPFVVASVWSFTNTRSPAASTTPSIVCNPDRVILLPVVAARTGVLRARSEVGAANGSAGGSTSKTCRLIGTPFGVTVKFCGLIGDVALKAAIRSGSPTRSLRFAEYQQRQYNYTKNCH